MPQVDMGAGVVCGIALQPRKSHHLTHGCDAIVARVQPLVVLFRFKAWIWLPSVSS
jgi:hypothetical protein